jgi:uncharacterized protein (TIGR02284 family)
MLYRLTCNQEDFLMTEPMDRAAVVTCLNDLIETSRDGENGFRQCAEKANDAKLKQVFTARASDCRSAIDELTRYVTQYGGAPEKSGSAAAAAHRVWLTIREGVTNSDASILAECERGEDRAVAAYRKALKQSLPADVQGVVQRQMEGVQRNHDLIKTLRDQYKD